MVRTQIYLTQNQRSRIRRTGAPIAEFIRDAVDKKLADAEQSGHERVKALHEAAGAWKDRGVTGDEYQIQMRRRRPR